MTKITIEGSQGSHLAKTPFVASDSEHILEENLNGCALVAEGFHKEIPKGYIYFAMAFSVGVESLNLRLRSKQAAVKVELHQPYR